MEWQLVKQLYKRIRGCWTCTCTFRKQITQQKVPFCIILSKKIFDFLKFYPLIQRNFILYLIQVEIFLTIMAKIKFNPFIERECQRSILMSLV